MIVLGTRKGLADAAPSRDARNFLPVYLLGSDSVGFRLIAFAALDTKIKSNQLGVWRTRSSPQEK